MKEVEKKEGLGRKRRKERIRRRRRERDCLGFFF